MNAETINGINENQPKGNEYVRIISYYSHKWIYILCILFNIIGGIIPYLIMMNLGSIFNNYNYNYDEDLFNFLSKISQKLKIMAILSAVMIIILNSGYVMRSFSDSLFVRDIRDLLFQNLMKLDISFFDKVQTGVLMCNLSEDVTIVLSEFIILSKILHK